MSSERSIGHWALAGLMINSVIASGIFGVPGELLSLVGRASPWAFVLGALVSAFIVACFVEVGSQFSAGGGPYLYARTAFGRFVGIQAGWFAVLTPVAAAAAQANLFVNYLASFDESLGIGAPRTLIICALITLPVLINLRGAAAGTRLSSVLVLAKLTPLILLISAGILLSTRAAARPLSVAHHSLHAWFTAVLLGAYGYGGFEDVLAATGDVRRPTRSVAFALLLSLATCALIYVLIQWVCSVFLDQTTVDHRPLASVASVLFGSAGRQLVAVAAMVSTAGAISATVLAVPRLLAAMGQGGDLPSFLGRTRTTGGAPVVTTVILGLVAVFLAVTGSFVWMLVLTAGSGLLVAACVCAALPRLRVSRPLEYRVTVPAGVAVAGIALGFIAVLLLQLSLWQAAALLVTAAIAAINWWLAMRREWQKRCTSDPHRRAQDSAG